MNVHKVVALFAFQVAMGAMAGDYDVVLKSYGSPGFVAGSGLTDSGNSWIPSMEGTNALYAELSNTHMTMADGQGNLYLADKDSHAILKIRTDGNIHTVAGTHVAGNGGNSRKLATTVDLNSPNGLFVLTNGTVFILDTDNDKIRRLDPDGYMTTVVSNTLFLDTGRGLWVSTNQSVIFYCAKTWIGKWTPGGGVTTYATNFQSLGNIEVDPTDGNLVATDPGANRVYRVFPDGSRTVMAGDGSSSFHGDGGPASNAGLWEVRGIAFLPNGGYFLATQRGGDIWYVDTNDMAHVFLDGTGTSSSPPPAVVAEPRGISISPSGALIITENDFAVVRVLPRTFAVGAATFGSATGLTLSWYSMPSVLYRVESSTNLTGTNWHAVSTLTGNVADVVTTYTTTEVLGTSRSFYRIRR